MPRSLDELFGDFRREAVDPRVQFIETRVWAAVEKQRSAPSSLVGARVRAASIGAALLVGALTGTVTAAMAGPRFNDVGAFSVHAALAPSTLLDLH